jgi:4-hydroxybenzoate polyprenyltransferase
VSAAGAATLGIAFLTGGVLAAAQATPAAFFVAVTIAALVVLYDAVTKRHAIAGPINMGLCRALNLLLGVSATPAALWSGWPLGLFSLIYIAAVTTVSRGEVHGGRTPIARMALISLVAVVVGLLALTIRSATGRFAGVVLVAALAYRVLPPYWQVLKEPHPVVIRRAVKAGVLSLVLVDATISAAYAGPIYAAAVLATGLVAGSLARLFSVT